MDLQFKIKNQKIILGTNIRKQCSQLISDSHNYVYLYFDFLTSDWEDTVKYCIISTIDGKNYKFLINDDEPLVLSQTITKDRYFNIGVYGNRTRDSYEVYRVTTDSYRVELGKSSFTTDISNMSEDISKDVISELFSLITETESRLDTKIDESVEYLDFKKSDKGHTHVCNDLTDYVERHQVEVTSFCNDLVSKIMGD